MNAIVTKALEAIAQSPNQKILMMPLDATSILGSIGGIAEIAREAFGGGSTETPKRKGASSVPGVTQKS